MSRRGEGGRPKALPGHPKIREIEAALASGESVSSVARRFDVARRTLSDYNNDVLIPLLALGPTGVQAREELAAMRMTLEAELGAAESALAEVVRPSPLLLTGGVVEPSPLLTGEVVEPEVGDPITRIRAKQPRVWKVIEGVRILRRRAEGMNENRDDRLILACWKMEMDAIESEAALLEKEVSWIARLGLADPNTLSVTADRLHQWLAEDPDTCVTCDSPLKDADGDWLIEATDEQVAEAFQFLAHLLLIIDEEEPDSE